MDECHPPGSELRTHRHAGRHYPTAATVSGHMRRLPLLAAAALVACLLAPAPAPAARNVPPGFFGVMTDGILLQRSDEQLTHEFDLMKADGVETIRPVVLWADMQPERGGAVDFGQTDRIFAQAATHGMHVVPVVLRVPSWARIVAGNFASPPKDPKTYGAFLAALIGRYGPGGTFWADNPSLPVRPQRDWEVWNEPNLNRYWSSPIPFAKGFVALMKVAHDAIKQADPGGRVILAAFGNDSWRALRKAYAAGLRGSMFDVAALHPFSGRLSNVLKIIRLNHDVFAQHGDGGKPEWITEITWPSALGKTKNTTGFETTESGQASRLTAAFRAFVRIRSQDHLLGAIWSTWLTEDRGSANSFDWSGLRKLNPSDPGGEPIDKPALKAYRAVALPLEGRAR